MRAKTSDPTPRLHLSLDVSDLDASTAFYGRLFGAEPAKREPGYAKFELDEPPLVLALQPGRSAARGRVGGLNHLGLRFRDRAALRAAVLRVELRGLRGEEELGVTCCYAVQDKLWLADPDGNAWELYTVLADVASGDRSGAGGCCEPAAAPEIEDEEPVAGARPSGPPAACCADGACGVR